MQTFLWHPLTPKCTWPSQNKSKKNSKKTFSVIMPPFTFRGWAYLRKLLYSVNFKICIVNFYQGTCLPVCIKMRFLHCQVPRAHACLFSVKIRLYFVKIPLSEHLRWTVMSPPLLVVWVWQDPFTYVEQLVWFVESNL